MSGQPKIDSDRNLQTHTLGSHSPPKICRIIPNDGCSKREALQGWQKSGRIRVQMIPSRKSANSVLDTQRSQAAQGLWSLWYHPVHPRAQEVCLEFGAKWLKRWLLGSPPKWLKSKIWLDWFRPSPTDSKLTCFRSKCHFWGHFWSVHWGNTELRSPKVGHVSSLLLRKMLLWISIC